MKYHFTVESGNNKKRIRNNETNQIDVIITRAQEESLNRFETRCHQILNELNQKNNPTTGPEDKKESYTFRSDSDLYDKIVVDSDGRICRILERQLNETGTQFSNRCHQILDKFNGKTLQEPEFHNQLVIINGQSYRLVREFNMTKIN